MRGDEISDDEFDGLVDDALDRIPEELSRLVHNVVVLVEDVPIDDLPDDTLGLYDGIAITDRSGQDSFDLPDRIFIFRRPLVELCRDRDELIHEIEVTVVHEVAHHFGIDDDRLHELGYG